VARGSLKRPERPESEKERKEKRWRWRGRGKEGIEVKEKGITRRR
jgi:hypothetical protein